MNGATASENTHRCICEDIANLMRSFGPSDQVVEHFRSARVEVLKGIRQMIDDRIERVEKKGQKGTSFGVE